MGTKAMMTAEQYAVLDEPDGVRYELSEGELIVSPSPMLFHNEVRDEIAFRLREFVKQHRLGQVTMETDFQLTEDTVRRPDVAFISAEKLAHIDPHKRLQIAPDLAVEVASPSDRPDDLMHKVQQYLNAGTATVLVIYPEAHLAYLYRGHESVQVFESGPIQLLPGFTLNLAEIFG
ncbi:MAG TPA: Uma2 family endonuclease [Terriglobia bacterium]|nr:Uma2 family endonuclease [Terriglobia bacterium]